jgi:L-lactate utilization protein LutC
MSANKRTKETVSHKRTHNENKLSCNHAQATIMTAEQIHAESGMILSVSQTKRLSYVSICPNWARASLGPTALMLPSRASCSGSA